MSATIVRHISVSDEKARQEPMKSILKGIENNMPSEVVEELQKKGVWHVMRGEGSEVQYNLANGENGEDVTLRLDFTYIDGRLISYVSKDYGFTEEMKKSGGDGYPSRNLLGFADDFSGGKAKFVEGITLEEVSRLKKKGVIKDDGNINTIAPLKRPKIWNDGAHNHYKYYGDIRGATYLLNDRIDMVVGYERSGMDEGEDSAVEAGGDDAGQSGDEKSSSSEGRVDGTRTERIYGMEFVLPEDSEEVPLKQYVKDERYGYSYKQYPAKVKVRKTDDH